MKKLLVMLLCCALTLGLCSLALAEDVPATEGVGTSYTFRLNGTNTSFYNTAFAFVQFDADGKIVDVYVDVLEIADPHGDHGFLPPLRCGGPDHGLVRPDRRRDQGDRDHHGSGAGAGGGLACQA